MEYIFTNLAMFLVLMGTHPNWNMTLAQTIYKDAIDSPIYVADYRFADSIKNLPNALLTYDSIYEGMPNPSLYIYTTRLDSFEIKK